MIIKQLILLNFGKHDRIEFKCDGAVVGLLGPNGSGKSTILDALELAITGEARDTIPSYVRYGRSNASVEMNFQKNGREGTILRQFGKTVKRKLLWDGKTIIAAREVDAIMQDIFGADKNAVANAVFINQGMLQNILFRKEADRKMMFIKLVNMSFCEQRRGVIESRIKRLAATISDMGPLLDEKRRQMGEALTAAHNLKVAWEAMPDYTSDLQFCDAYLIAEDRLKQVTTEMGRIANESGGHQSRMTEVLTGWSLTSYEDAAGFMEKKEIELKNVAAEHQSFTSIRMELGHYKSVLTDIETYTRQLQESMDRQRSINPQELTDEMIDQMVAKFEAAVQVHDTLAGMKHAMEQNLEAMKTEQNGLMALKKPGVPEDWIQNEHQRLTTMNALLASMRKFKSLREEAKQCMEPGQLKCHKCGLTLADPSELSEKGLADLNAEIEKIQTEAIVLANYLDGQKQVWTAYKTAHASYTAQINALTNSITSARRQIEGTIPEFSKVVAEREYNRLTELRAQLPELRRATQSLSGMIQDKIRAKEGYPLAVKHWDRQNDYGTEQELARKSKHDAVELETKAYRKQFEEMTRLSGLLQSLASRTQMLIDERLVLMRRLEQPMPPNVSASVTATGSLSAAKGDLNVRQQSRSALHGRYEQAKLIFDGLEQEYEQLQIRAKAEEAKQKVVEDLKILDEVMKPDGLPMAVVRHHFKHLASLTQAALNQLNSNFSIEIDPDEELSFRFTRLDEAGAEPLPMNKLSGGQRVRLCTAFLIAVQQRLVKEVGLLVLDEPTTHADDAGVEALADFITDLGSQLQNTEMQIWIADHALELRRSMQKVLELA